MKKIILGLSLVSQITYAADFTVQFSAEDNSISTVKIQDGAVTSDKIADESIDDSKISSISTAKISNFNSAVDARVNQYPPIGYNQTWQNPSRNAGTVYTNTTGRPIMVLITCQSTGGSFTPRLVVQGVELPLAGTTANTGTYSSLGGVIIPPGHTYYLNASGGAISAWAELR